MTAKNMSWTRATTLASTLADRYGLEKWAQRNTVLGLGLRQDLYALAVSSTADDRDQLESIVEQAQEAAKAQSGANLGTALHAMTERIDRGEDLDVPDTWKADIDAYCQTLADNSIRIHSEWIERIVVNPDCHAAGTLDRIVSLNGQLVIADLKTGQDVVKYGMTEIALQLAIYATATHVRKDSVPQRDRYGRYLLPHPDNDPDGYDPMPPVNQETGLVIHLPVGQATCHLYEVDLTAGRQAVDLALAVRDWRKRKDLATPLARKEPQLALVDDW